MKPRRIEYILSLEGTAMSVTLTRCYPIERTSGVFSQVVDIEALQLTFNELPPANEQNTARFTIGGRLPTQEHTFHLHLFLHPVLLPSSVRDRGGCGDVVC